MKSEKEIWKAAVGLEGRYEISSIGRLRSLDRSTYSKKSKITYNYKGRMIKTGLNRKGYYSVSLRKNDKSFTAIIHRLVAIAFIKNPSNKEQVNHIDGNKINNKVENLEWCTNTENIRHAFRTGLFDNRIGSRCGNSKLNEKQVLEIFEMIKAKKIIYKDIAKKFNVSTAAIALIAMGRNWSHLTGLKRSYR